MLEVGFNESLDMVAIAGDDIGISGADEEWLIANKRFSREDGVAEAFGLGLVDPDYG